MTSSHEEEEPRAGTQQVQSANAEKVGSNGHQVNSHSEATSTRQHEVLHHFIHTPEDVKRSQDMIIESSSIETRQLPSESNRIGEQGNKSCVAEQGPLYTSEEASTSADVSEAVREDSSTDGSEECAGNVGGEKKRREKKKKAPKNDRSNLRKGKWTVEEEEYTSRIIHHFSTGVLTLPEGTTLRSYLAEKLKCDPMRITKKFAGASCLGKRVYHLCDRSQATVGDIDMAKAELVQLEHRFRLRVEHGQSVAPPLPPQVIPSQPNPAPLLFAVPGHPAPAAVAASWLQTIAKQMGAQVPTTVQFGHGPPLQPSYQVTAPVPWAFVSPIPKPTVAPAPAPLPMHTATNEAINMAWAQAAASLTPALSQLAAANLQQHQQQLQKAYDNQLQSYGQQQMVPNQHYSAAQLTATPTTMVFAAQAPGQQLAPAPAVMAPPPCVPPIAPVQSFVQPPPVPIAPQPLPQMVSKQASIAAKPSELSIQPRPVQVPPLSNVIVQNAGENDHVGESVGNSSRSKDDVDAGSMLMGFLNSLHKGFLDAKRLKDEEDRVLAAQQLVWANKAAAMAVMGESQETSSGRTSQPADSSPEDSQSEVGGKDPSSSEESDAPMERLRGPPRKRHKTKIGEFTSLNVAAHTTRMDALHHAGHHRHRHHHAEQHQDDDYADAASKLEKS